MKIMVQVPTPVAITDDQLINLIAQRAREYLTKHVGEYYDTVKEVEGQYLRARFTADDSIAEYECGEPVPREVYEGYKAFSRMLNLLHNEKNDTTILH